MTALPLTIRNLSSTPLELKQIERYEPQASTRGLGHITKNFANFTINSTKQLETPVAENVKSFELREVSVRVDPFKIQSTDIKAFEHSQQEVLCLTFESEGQEYTIHTSSPENASQTLTPITPNPKLQFTAVFLPEDAYLTVYSSANLNSWMQHLKDETPLSALSVPGTHNSPTCHRALPSVRCQAVSPKVQLANGVRFFDIRVQPEAPHSADLVLVHGVFPISLTGPKYFRDLITDAYTFLDQNPSETLIMSIKREGTGTLTDQQLSRILFDHYTNGTDAPRWYSDPNIPTLGQARGKVVLMRRFAVDDALRGEHDGRGWGIDAQSWTDNTPHDVHGDVCVQDFYEVMEAVNIDKKIDYCEAQLERAGACVCQLPGITTDKVNPVPPQPFYLNFLSASNFWKKECWPEKIARRLNPVMVRWLCMKHHLEDEGDGGTGIVVCDWVGADGNWDLVRCIVGMNSKLMVREMAL